MANGSLKAIWENTDIKDQAAVNQAMKDSVFIIDPAVEKLWKLNLKVNILYAIIIFVPLAVGFIFKIVDFLREAKP